MGGKERNMEGEKESEEEEKRRQETPEEEEGGRKRQDREMKDEDWLSHKLPKALLLTVFLSENERTLLR